MNRTLALALLVVMGAGWGLTQPLAKIAVSEGYRNFGLIFWQFAIAGTILTGLNALRGRGLPLGARQVRLYVIIALIGTVLPNGASYEAARFLPSGFLSILISTVPMFAFPIALALGNDRFGWLRLGGLVLGLGGVLLLTAPHASLPDRALVAFIPLALVAPAFYGLEGNVVSRWGTYGCDAIQVLLGASLVGIVLAAPLAALTGTWITPTLPLTRPEYALILSSITHALVYATYVWLIGRAGAVYAAQVGYLVTGFGVLWAMLILGERYSGWVWAAMALILAGVALVQPRPRQEALAEAAAIGIDDA